MGQILIFLTALLVAVMPVTEYLWTFDKFLRGGQDCEFGLLALAAILSLVLVLSHQHREILAFVLSLRRVLSSLFQTVGLNISFAYWITRIQRYLQRSTSYLSINLPLQI